MSLARRAGLALLGLALGLLALEGCLRAASLVLRAAGTDARAAAEGKTRVLCIGESTTAPTGLPDSSWPKQLEGLLNEAAGSARWQVINKGRRGTNTALLAANLKEELETYRPAAIVAMMGVNDTRWFGAPPARGRLGRFLERTLSWKASRRLLRRPGQEAPPPDDPHLVPLPDPESQEIARCRREGAWEVMERLWRARARAGRPLDASALIRLHRHHLDSGRPDRAEGLLAALPASQAAHPAALLCKALGAGFAGKPAGTQALRRAAAGLAGGCHLWGDAVLISLFREAGSLEDAEAIFQRDLELCRGRPLLAAVGEQLARSYEAAGLRSEAEKTMARAFRAASGAPAPRRLPTASEATRSNYAAVAALARRRGVPLLAMQYPLRPLSQLEGLLAGLPVERFISNEENFKGALARGRYEDLFTDRFAGDFGHATPRGDRLIAEAVLAALREAGVSP